MNAGANLWSAAANAHAVRIDDIELHLDVEGLLDAPNVRLLEATAAELYIANEAVIAYAGRACTTSMGADPVWALHASAQTAIRPHRFNAINGYRS